MVEENTTTEIESKEKFLKAQDEFIAEHTVRFELLDGALVLVMRIITRPVWNYVLVKCGVTAMSMNAEDMKTNKADGGRALQFRVKDQMDTNRTKIIAALVDRAGVEIPEWFTADMLDDAVADQFLEDYALEMMIVAQKNGREEAQIEKFRAHGLLPDDGADEQGASGEDPEPSDEAVPDPN